MQDKTGEFFLQRLRTAEHPLQDLTHLLLDCPTSEPLHRAIFVFVLSLSSCHEKARVAQYFGRIRTRLGVLHFRVFRLFL